jgi:hypothetical protein
MGRGWNSWANGTDGQRNSAWWRMCAAFGAISVAATPFMPNHAHRLIASHPRANAPDDSPARQSVPPREGIMPCRTWYVRFAVTSLADSGAVWLATCFAYPASFQRITAHDVTGRLRQPGLFLQPNRCDRELAQHGPDRRSALSAHRQVRATITQAHCDFHHAPRRRQRRRASVVDARYRAHTCHMLSTDEPDHKRLGDIVDEAFRRAVLGMEPHIQAIGTNLPPNCLLTASLPTSSSASRVSCRCR